MRRLLGRGADPDRESLEEAEGLPLCAAACWGHLDVVNALLAAGADPGLAEDRAGSNLTALFWAASNDHLGVVSALLEAGAEVDPADAAGRTPLSHAAERGSAAVVRVLLAHGADPGRRDRLGRTALELAEQYADADIEAEVRSRVRGDRISVRRETGESGDERVIAEARDHTGALSSEAFLGTGHAVIAELLRG